MSLREAAQQALEALEQIRTPLRINTALDAYDVSRAITALRTALAEPEQEPLTDEKVIEHFQTQVDTGSLMSFVDGVRYAERAHGIGGEA